jgi:hypothetical protein
MEEFVADLHDLVEALRKFQENHQWWPIQDFYDIQNKTLKKAVYVVLENNNECMTYLAQHGTTLDILSLEKELNEKAPRMMFVAMACFLNFIFELEKAEEPISEELIQWYRTRGWTFPNFKFEKEKDTKDIKIDKGQDGTLKLNLVDGAEQHEED